MLLKWLVRRMELGFSSYTEPLAECALSNKSSAAAEMGDRARAKWAETWGAAVPLSVGEDWGPSFPQGKRPISVPSGILNHPAVWPQQTWPRGLGA